MYKEKNVFWRLEGKQETWVVSVGLGPHTGFNVKKEEFILQIEVSKQRHIK